MKTNFKKNNKVKSEDKNMINIDRVNDNLTKEEFEEYISKSGAKGSFMVYRSTKKEEELGLDEL